MNDLSTVAQELLHRLWQPLCCRPLPSRTRHFCSALAQVTLQEERCTGMWVKTGTSTDKRANERRDQMAGTSMPLRLLTLECHRHVARGRSVHVPCDASESAGNYFSMRGRFKYVERMLVKFKWKGWIKISKVTHQKWISGAGCCLRPVTRLTYGVSIQIRPL